MARDQSLQRFYAEFMQEVNFSSEIETNGWTTEDYLTSVMLEYLEEAGEAESPIICPYRAPGLQLNAYSFSEDFSSLDIFISIFSSSEEPKQLPQAEIDSAIKRAVQLFHESVSDLHKSLYKDNETSEFAMSLRHNQSSIENVNVFALTNGLIKPAILNNIEIGNATISTELSNELVSISRPGSQARKSVASIDSITDEEQKQNEKAEAVPASTWFSISRWAKEAGNLLP